MTPKELARIMLEPVPEYKVGQVWKDAKRKPESVFLVTNVWIKTYTNGDTATRVTGVVSAEQYVDMNRDLDARSIHKMWPYLMFDPPVDPDSIDTEDK